MPDGPANSTFASDASSAGNGQTAAVGERGQRAGEFVVRDAGADGDLPAGDLHALQRLDPAERHVERPHRLVAQRRPHQPGGAGDGRRRPAGLRQHGHRIVDGGGDVKPGLVGGGHAQARPIIIR